MPCLLRNLPSEFCGHTFLSHLPEVSVLLYYPEYVKNVYFLNGNIISSEESTWLHGKRLLVIPILTVGHVPFLH